MLLSLEQIYMFSLCPKAYRFSDKHPALSYLDIMFPATKETEVILRMAQLAYRSSFVNRQHVKWNQLRGALLKECVKNEVGPDKMLLALNDWFYKYYKKDNRVGLSNLIIKEQFCDAIITGNAPLVVLGDGDKYPHAFQVYRSRNGSLLKSEKEDMQNNFLLRAYLWLLSRHVGANIHTIEVFSLSKNTVTCTEISVPPEHNSMESNIEQILKSILHGVDYPSQNLDICNNCFFRKDCTI